MKRIYPLVALALIAFCITPALAVETTTVETLCRHDHLLVPARPVVEDLGGSVIWTRATRAVTATLGDTRVVMQVDYPRAQVNGREYDLAVSPALHRGHVMMPLRFTAEALGYTVEYRDGEVTLLSDGKAVRKIVSADGPPKCVLDEEQAAEQEKVQEEASRAEPTEDTGATPEPYSKPINCDIRGFEREVIESEKPVLVDFWAPWCGPCLMMEPTLDRIARRYAGKAKVVKVDISKSCNQPLVLDYNVHSIPYLAVFKDGQIIEPLVGVRPEQDIAAALDRAITD